MSDDRFEQAVFKIFRMTHLGELSWHSAVPPRNLRMGTDSVFPAYFETIYQEKRLALFQERYRYFVPEIEDERWNERTCLALLAPDGEMAFEFPPTRQVHDLLEAVRYKTSDVEGLLNDLLSPKSTNV